MRITTLALGLCLCLAAGCDDSKKDVKDGKVEAKTDAKADAKATDVKAADAKVEDAKAEDAKAADAKLEDAKAAAGGAAADAAAVAKIGVAECDEYITKMTACIASGGIPAEQIEAQKMGLSAYQNSWTDAMKSNPADGAALVPGCKAAIEMGKVSHPSCFESK